MSLRSFKLKLPQEESERRISPAAMTPTVAEGGGRRQPSERKKDHKHQPARNKEFHLERFHSPQTVGSGLYGRPDRHQGDDDAIFFNLQVNRIVNKVVEGQTDEEVVDVAGPRLLRF